MAIESDFYTILSSDVDLAALVGSRIYPATAPDTAERPCIEYEVARTEGERNLAGDFFPYAQNFRLWLLADAYADIVQVKSAVVALDGASGGDILTMELDEGTDGYEADTEIFTKVINVRCTIR